ncbi:hypothetical protein ACFXTI_040247 [Malus domestica]
MTSSKSTLLITTSFLIFFFFSSTSTTIRLSSAQVPRNNLNHRRISNALIVGSKSDSSRRPSTSIFYPTAPATLCSTTLADAVYLPFYAGIDALCYLYNLDYNSCSEQGLNLFEFFT